MAAETELQIDREELRESLGINALENENAALRAHLSEWMTYSVMLHRELQELRGEGQVTEDLQANVQPGGNVTWQRRRPPLPGNVGKFSRVLQGRPEAKANGGSS